MRLITFLFLLITLCVSFCGLISKSYAQESLTSVVSQLNAIQDDNTGTISIYRENSSEPILVQNAQEEIRPYIHPIIAPDNKGFPIPWRVDNELGVGPSRQILGDWNLDEGETEIVRYRLVVYTGDLAASELTHSWIEYITEE